MGIPMNDDIRRDTRLEWARFALADPQADLARASTDAGFRSYWRSNGRDGSRIVMDSPPDKEDVRPWLRMRELLEHGGVRVPRVLA
ncbi:MAG TPA: phosphotransferase, partial [Xanthomonadaceae bacterium]|nr:phosphotransferase [Xanthomonadaceae bacterium]